MMRISFRSIPVLLVLAATPVAVQGQGLGAETPSAAVEEFFKAAADSNLTRMAQLFGTSRGSASRTGEPRDFAKRMVIMQAFLHDTRSRAVSEVASGQRDQMLVTTEIARGACKAVVSVTTYRSRDGWIVRSFDLDQVSTVINRPCADPSPAPTGNSPN